MTLLALVPLFSVVLMLLWRGGQRLGLSVFTELPPAPLEQGGGGGLLDTLRGQSAPPAGGGGAPQP